MNAQLIVYNGSKDIPSGSTIKNAVFSEGNILQAYRILPSANISDLPKSLQGNSSYYVFLTKVSLNTAIGFNSGGVVFIVTYINNNVMFREITSSLMS